jgi:glycosyltransferase involved in cell wall biosynthesis
MIVYRKTIDDSTVQGFLDDYPRSFGRRDTRWIINRLNYVGRKIVREIRLRKWRPESLFTLNMPFVGIDGIKDSLNNANIICLYSVESFLSSRLIKSIYRLTKAPIVWTAVDMEPLSGGCHFNNGCNGFMKSCGNCPQLEKSKENDISRRTWNRKNNDLKHIPITFVAGSSWARRHINKSALFGGRKIKDILLSVDEKFSFNASKETARKILQLPSKKRIVLFGCFDLNDKRKGGEYLFKALNKMSAKTQSNGLFPEDILLVTIGRKSNLQTRDLYYPWIHLGELKDDRIVALVYKAADVFACPSIDDFGPMMINESVMCGTPVVAFRSGVAPDLIKSDSIGYLANKFDSDDFSNGLKTFLKTRKTVNPNTTDKRIQEVREMLSPLFQAREYISLFNELLKEKQK